jgi:hypothetical protein
MADAIALPLATLLLLAGFTLLALLQDRHRERVRPACLPAQHGAARSLLAAALMLASLLLCIAGEGLAFGVLAWVVLSNLAALAVVLCLAWCPALLRPLVRGSPGAG